MVVFPDGSDLVVGSGVHALGRLPTGLGPVDGEQHRVGVSELAQAERTELSGRTFDGDAVVGRGLVDRVHHADWATGLLHRYMEDYRLGREIAE